jgi:hypothetical protein
MKNSVDRFKNYLTKARKRRRTAEEQAQLCNFEGAVKNYGLAIRFVRLAKKQFNNINEQNDETRKMSMAVCAAEIDITLRRVEVYRIDGSMQEALNDVTSILTLLSTMTHVDVVCNKIGSSYQKICAMRIDVLIEMNRFQECIDVMVEQNEPKQSIVDVLSLQLNVLKKTSNELYKEGALQDAVTGYTSALRLLLAAHDSQIDLSGNNNAQRHVLLANRAACYMRLVPIDARNAAQDLEVCVSIAPEYIKGWTRLVRLYTDTQNVAARKIVAQKGLVHHANHPELMAALKMEEEGHGRDENSSVVENVVDGGGGGTSTCNSKSKREPTAEEKVEALKKMMLGL